MKRKKEEIHQHCRRYDVDKHIFWKAGHLLLLAGVKLSTFRRPRTRTNNGFISLSRENRPVNLSSAAGCSRVKRHPSRQDSLVCLRSIALLHCAHHQDLQNVHNSLGPCLNKYHLNCLCIESSQMCTADFGCTSTWKQTFSLDIPARQALIWAGWNGIHMYLHTQQANPQDRFSSFYLMDKCQDMSQTKAIYSSCQSYSMFGAWLVPSTRYFSYTPKI